VGAAGSGVRFRVHRFVNLGASGPVSVLLRPSGADSLNVVAYRGSFDPADPCANFLGELGCAPAEPGPGSFAFWLGGGEVLELVVHEVNPDSSEGAYKLELFGLANPDPGLRVDHLRVLNAVRLSWTAAGDFLVPARSKTLGGAQAWTALEPPAFAAGGSYSLVLPWEPGSHFFRLEQP